MEVNARLQGSGTVNIHAGEGTAGPVLATASFAFTFPFGPDGWVSLSIDKPPFISSGSTCTVHMVSGPAPSSIQWHYSFEDPYPNGQASVPFNDLSGHNQRDFMFRTYVTPGAEKPLFFVDGGGVRIGTSITGGRFSAAGGFWSGVVAIKRHGGSVRTTPPGAPLLTIESWPGGSVRISWPAPATGFVLEQASALAAPPAVTAWTPVNSPYQTNAEVISLTAPAAADSRFYRLRQP